MPNIGKQCPVLGVKFYVDERDQLFYDKVSPLIGGQKLSIPPPTLAPNARQQRRLAFRNERYLYRSTCNISGRSIVSAYSPEKRLKVCSKEEWLKLDNTQFGRDFDFSRSFFEQFADLYRETYKIALMQAGDMVNSEYAHFCGWLKNCYWVFDMGKSEDCMYGVFMAYARDCIDGLYLSQCELCYDAVHLENCYQVSFSGYSTNCNSSAYLYNCIGCSNCIACTNLRNKEYYVLNQPVGREQYHLLAQTIRAGRHSAHLELQQKFTELLLATPRKATRNLNCENCSGDDLTRCANVHDSYNCLEARDCRYVYDMYMRTHDCYDIATFGESMDYCYELSGCGGKLEHSQVSNCYFSVYIYYGGCNILYSNSCHENSQDLFGCCDLRKKQYCILNKQYSKEEYEALVPRIVEHMRQTGEWGEFFPMWLSPFGYNESLADEFYPLTEEQTQKLKAPWSSYVMPAPVVKSTIAAGKLPDAIGDVKDEILDSAILCNVTRKPFKITKRELEFYRKEGIPLPRLHPEERHRRRRKFWLNPRRLWGRTCASTGREITSSYPPDAPEIVYSEEAYLKEVQ